MIWFDIVTPKDVLFFMPIIRRVESLGEEVVITTRYCEGYSETVELLNLYNMKYISLGKFGGSLLLDKLAASINRQMTLMEYISNKQISKLVSLCSVDANRVAFGLGIPIINFYDIPLSDHKTDFKKVVPQARLTLPLSEKVFKPFVVPDEIFIRFSLEKNQIYEYKFIDPLIWLNNFKPDFNYLIKVFDEYKIDPYKPYILIREEEYKASYVDKRHNILYESINDLFKTFNCTIIFIPRYESDYLENQFPYCTILKKKIIIQHLINFASLFIGGGGTLNTEACYFGTPTISTRSFISHYDKYQIDNGLMFWVSSKDELINKSKEIFGERFDNLAKKVFGGMEVNIDYIVNNMLDNP